MKLREKGTAILTYVAFAFMWISIIKLLSDLINNVSSILSMQLSLGRIGGEVDSYYYKTALENLVVNLLVKGILLIIFYIVFRMFRNKSGELYLKCEAYFFAGLGVLCVFLMTLFSDLGFVYMAVKTWDSTLVFSDNILSFIAIILILLMHLLVSFILIKKSGFILKKD